MSKVLPVPLNQYMTPQQMTAMLNDAEAKKKMKMTNPTDDIVTSPVVDNPPPPPIQGSIIKDTFRICEDVKPPVVQIHVDENEITDTINGTVILPREECTLTVYPREGKVITQLLNVILMLDSPVYGLSFNILKTENQNYFKLCVKNPSTEEAHVSIQYTVSY